MMRFPICAAALLLPASALARDSEDEPEGVPGVGAGNGDPGPRGDSLRSANEGGS